MFSWSNYWDYCAIAYDVQDPNRITLSQTTRDAEETSWGAIHQNKKVHWKNTMCYPIPQFLTKATPHQQV